MTQKANMDNLLIDFNNLNVDDESSSSNWSNQNSNKSVALDQNNASTTAASESMAFLCSSEPLYKLLNSGSVDADDNNPFDHFDKQACLSDDPFEIVVNAALISSSAPAEAELLNVETGTLISIESPIISKSESGNEPHSKAEFDTPKKANPSSETHDSVQITPPILKNLSPIPRGKAKSTSLNLLKYSLSNTRLDLAGESGSHGDELLSGDEIVQKKQKYGPTAQRESSKDDSFDDIWATKPNLIDSQTDIDIDSDIDNDIAKLNIPMLNIPTNGSKSGEKSTSKEGDQISEETVESRAVNRSQILEKLASIKQKIPQSPMTIDTSTVAVTTPTHSQTVDITCTQAPATIEDEPATPKSQYSTVVLPPESSAYNRNSLIENLMKLVDQCDDKNKQSTAKHLLDDLSSILQTANKGNDNQERRNGLIGLRPPQPIKRQGTFSIEKNADDTVDDSKLTDTEYSKESIKADGEISPIDPALSEVMKQIQNAFGSHQNVNVLQPMENTTANAANPTYIVVMTQPVADFGENGDFQRLQRARSQSLSAKEKPLAAVRAVQQKVEPSPYQSTPMTTPIQRPPLQRRSSFGTITRTTPKNEKIKSVIPPVKADAAKVIRRRSLQGPTMVNTKPTPKESEPAQMKPLNPVARRRSFQGPPISTTGGIRSPSPKPSLNSNLNRPNAPLRLQSSTTGTLTRRKSFASDLTNSTKDSPQKLRTSYGIMKKPQVPPATRNLKIRVSQTVGGRSTAPLRAFVPMKSVASMLLINETVASVDNNKGSFLITSTPRSVLSKSPTANIKTGSLAERSELPAESPIPSLKKDRTYLTMTPPKPSVQAAYSSGQNRRRTLSDYRSEVNNSVTVDPSSSGKTVSSIKNATKTLASGLSKFKRMSGIGLKKPSSTASKENKQP
ncbi:mucin-2-like [Sitodiplosis mosellana]|uniref:mucin-2-like n=1 Tax=Sitodiplosis mosellana TaxID=263140 RepID=UPI0024442665|nr:mucin-2-like [Sitodiplosis mosellana]